MYTYEKGMYIDPLPDLGFACSAVPAKPNIYVFAPPGAWTLYTTVLRSIIISIKMVISRIDQPAGQRLADFLGSLRIKMGEVIL